VLWSVPNPLRRGAAAVAVTGGAFSLVGGAAPEARPEADVVPVAQARSAVGALPDDAVAGDAVPADVWTDDAVTGALEVVVTASVEPIEPEPEIADAAELVKAVQLAEQQIARATEQAAAQAQAAQAEADAAARGPVDCGLSTGGLGRVKSHVRTAAAQLGCRFGEPAMHGVAGRAGTSDHPGGLAVDFMVDRSTGDALAACALENMDALGVKYVIWEQAINHGSGWEPMQDRGGATANHFDHVHISFDRGGGDGSLRGC
jgi:hypothetical protein